MKYIFKGLKCLISYLAGGGFVWQGFKNEYFVKSALR
jgi:hypothetical protein